MAVTTRRLAIAAIEQLRHDRYAADVDDDVSLKRLWAREVIDHCRDNGSAVSAGTCGTIVGTRKITCIAYQFCGCTMVR